MSGFPSHHGPSLAAFRLTTGLLRGILLLASLVPAFTATDVRLQAPLTTIHQSDIPLAENAVGIEAAIVVGSDAPPDLGWGVYLTDRHGSWFQHPIGPIGPGTHQARVDLAADGWTSEPSMVRWDGRQRHRQRRFGIYLWSAQASEARVQVHAHPVRGRRQERTGTGVQRFLDLEMVAAADERAGMAWQAQTGRRWQLQVRPDPTPVMPSDPERFAMDLEVHGEESEPLRIPGFWYQPFRIHDRGDREIMQPHGTAVMRFRWRPHQAGGKRLRLQWSQEGAEQAGVQLPDLQVHGAPWDDMVRVDEDPRFFRTGAQQWWPVGLNIAAPTDERSRERYGTAVTPNRGVHSYEAYFARLAAAGGDAVEIWLSAWNLAIEWQAGWPGWWGAFDYHQGNAARLDAVLDAAWKHGIRVIITIDNHGKAQLGSNESQWQDHPFNEANGGWAVEPEEAFTHPRSLAAQSARYRYLMARYGDHPAVAMWKLWSEVDLTTLGIKGLRKGYRGSLRNLAKWHRWAGAYFEAHDIYQHPVATHFATHYRYAKREVVSLDEIDVILVDNYHRPKWDWQGPTLAHFLLRTLTDRNGGLGRYHKPVMATEYGGGKGDLSHLKLGTEHSIGAWSALVSGHAGAPMLWWFEWVDQGDHWEPYAAIRPFLEGEDLRSRPDDPSGSVPFESSQDDCWARGWVRQGRVLGYLLDTHWASVYDQGRVLPASELLISRNAQPGTMRLSWWDADRGIVLREVSWDHGGGSLSIDVPPFKRHVAFKLVRE